MKMRSYRDDLKTDPRWSSSDMPVLQNLLSHESRERLNDACREMSANGEWELADLSAYMRSGERQQARKEGVYVGTAHSAKGREWDTVFIVGCEEGSFPQAKKDTDVEEERRLMFVAMTRARHRLVLTWCKARPQSRGPNLPPGPLEPRQPSRFIKESGL
jgi:DNA helicase-2/ATP-dependent DNA helicase PcrA